MPSTVSDMQLRTDIRRLTSPGLTHIPNEYGCLAPVFIVGSNVPLTHETKL